MNPTPGQIIICNKTTADRLYYALGGPNGAPAIASGYIDSQQCTSPIDVSGYEQYFVSFSPFGKNAAGGPSLATTSVTVEGDEPTRVSFAQEIF